MTIFEINNKKAKERHFRIQNNQKNLLKLKKSFMLDSAKTLIIAIAIFTISSLTFFYLQNKRRQKHNDALKLEFVSKKDEPNPRPMRVHLNIKNNISEMNYSKLSQSKTKEVLSNFFEIQETPKPKSTIKLAKFEKIDDKQENQNIIKTSLPLVEESKKDQSSSRIKTRKYKDPSEIRTKINEEEKKKNNNEFQPFINQKSNEEKEKKNNEIKNMTLLQKEIIKLEHLTTPIPEKNQPQPQKSLDEASKLISLEKNSPQMDLKLVQSVILTQSEVLTAKKIELSLQKVIPNLEEEEKKLDPKLPLTKPLEKQIIKTEEKAPDQRKVEMAEEREERKLEMPAAKKDENKNKANTLGIHAELEKHFLNKRKNKEQDEIEQTINKCLGSLLGDNIPKRLFETSRDLVVLYKKYESNEEYCLFFYFKIVETIAKNTLNIKIIGKVDDGQRNNIIDSLSRLSILLNLINLDCPHLLDYMINYLQSEVKLLIPEDILPKNEDNLTLDRFTSKVMMRSFCFFILINTDLKVNFLFNLF